MKLLLKNTYKKIFKSLGRFLSILFIVALGISVFIGLRESTTGMLYTADNYYDENNLMDFKVISTYGLNVDDVNALKRLSSRYKSIPTYSIDVLSDGEAIRVHAIEKDINKIILVKGKMPSKNNECVADYTKYKIGDNIHFDTEDDSILKINSCKVVGTIKSVLYVRGEKGISSVGNGKLISFVFVNKDVFDSKYYTEVYLISKLSRESNSYYDSYANSIKNLKGELEELKPIRETIRYEEVLQEANDEIIKIKKELNNKLKDATDRLNNSKLSLDNAKKALESTKTSTYKELNDNKELLLSSKENIITSINNLGITEEGLDKYITNLENQILNLNEELNRLEINTDEYNNIKNQIDTLESNYQNISELRDQLNSINASIVDLNNKYVLFEAEISNKEKEIESGYNDYYAGLEELDQNKEEANKKIEDAKSKLKDIEKPKWYLLDRTDNSGYINYKEDVIKVDAISKILPIFFILVVVLMILNTLTRLIEEERTEIGVLESNGYSKSSIIFTYLIYVCLAGLIGIALGLTIGYSLVPKIIYGVFLSRYYVPKLITIVSPLPFSLVIGITLLIMIIVTISACYKELKEVPANLLRPKAPKNGKKTFLERMKVLWSKLDFMWKITIRNLFRYKKRIIMTILGVSGCTALLLAGLGVNDSISTIANLQYSKIIKYEAMYILKDDEETLNDKQKDLFDLNVEESLLIKQETYTYSYDEKVSDVYLIMPSSDIKDFIFLNSIVNNKTTTLSDKGVIITKQMSDQLKASVGDLIKVRNDDNELFILEVSDVVENYVSNYIYINKEYYKEVFNKDIVYNTVITNGSIDDKINLTDYKILTVNNTDDILKTFDSFISGLNQIIIMIVVFACFLAFIVLYNLTIINVSERKREIATFKVLGFNDKEISIFVYRETLILTIIGIIFGLFLGIYLHKYIIYTAETDNVVFLKTIKPLSYLLSAIITIVFSYLVQLIINKTLKRIDMIDSLKSVE